jgi:hypothetical protein
LYEFGDVEAAIAVPGAEVLAAATLDYVGPGQDIVDVRLEPGAVTMEIYSLAGVACVGLRADGSETADFPRLLRAADAQIATINPGTSTIFAKGTGTTNVNCRLAYGSMASESAALTVTDRSPTEPVSLVLEAPDAPPAGVLPEVPTGTTVTIRVRAIDAGGSYAAHAKLVFRTILGGGSVSPDTVVTGNDGVAEASMIVGQGYSSVRVTPPGVTTPFVDVVRFGR